MNVMMGKMRTVNRPEVLAMLALFFLYQSILVSGKHHVHLLNAVFGALNVTVIIY